MYSDATATPSFFEALRRDFLFWTLLLVLVLLTATTPGKIGTYPSLVDWATIATLGGLLVLTKGVELSGYLTRLGKRLIDLMPTERALAVFLVLATALLSTLLTNDVAHAGSTLTPIGNPQNLFLWHQSHISFHQYVVAMLPLAAILMATLLLLTAVAFQGRRLELRKEAVREPVRAGLLLLSLLLYIPFLVCADLHYPVPALALVMTIFLVLHRDVLKQVDWPLILVFILMFIDLRLIAQTALMRSLIDSAGLANLRNLYFAGIATSQFISNVPAAILLSEYTREWRLVAYAVNVGGFGFILGSLANIIALRIVRERGTWLTFHAFSIPFLLVAGSLVYLWLFI
jgi:di/tricarboxylate transporter